MLLRIHLGLCILLHAHACVIRARLSWSNHSGCCESLGHLVCSTGPITYEVSVMCRWPGIDGETLEGRWGGKKDFYGKQNKLNVVRTVMIACASMPQVRAC